MLNVLTQIIVLFSLIAVGYFCKKTKLISNNMNPDVSSLLVNVTVPAMIIVSLSSLTFSERLLIETFHLLGISFFLYVFLVVISHFSVKLYRVKDTTRDIYRFGMVFGNTSYMGFPVAYALFGEQGLFFMAVCDVISPLFLWTFGVIIMGRPMDNGKSVEGGILFYLSKIKHIINPSIVAVVLGFFLFSASVKLPEAIEEILHLLGSLTTPLAMIFIGSVLADMDIKVIIQDKKAIIYSLQRLLLLPLVVLVILKLLGLEGYLLSIPVLYTAMPVAALTSILAAQYGNDYHLASKLIFISTSVSIFTIPAIAWILLR